MTAAFLYCWGYREMISSAVLIFSEVNSKGIFGLLYSVSRCTNNASESLGQEVDIPRIVAEGRAAAKRLRSLMASTGVGGRG